MAARYLYPSVNFFNGTFHVMQLERAVDEEKEPLKGRDTAGMFASQLVIGPS